MDTQTQTQSQVVDVSTAENYDKYVQDLFTTGKLIKLHIGMWGMSTQLQEKDLEIPPGTEIPSIFKLGRKMLIREEVYKGFKTIEGKARNYLDRNSFDFLAADAHFVPIGKVPDVLLDLYEFQRQFNAKRDDFIANYPQYKEDTLKEFEKFRESLEPYYPHPESIRNKFYFDVDVFQIALPEKVESVDLQAVLAQRKVEAEKRAEIEEKMGEFLVQQKAEMGRKIYGFVGECVTSLRESVYAASKQISEKIQKGEEINSRNLTSLQKVVGQFETLNFFNDTEVGTALGNLRNLISRGHDFKQNKDALGALKGSLAVVMEAAQKASDIPQLNGEFFRKFD